ncbi:hypothetical protein CPB83DRAFT_855305 [Crepidotus variabilis]|uniref:HAMP domain-containing protein n=1 Tax=Crepidotus variabilis TaxID=179855 RepID=A0A9P6JPM7_9AGAR|nr:hypothetical protein CPB83DRAFT_855305 [Crepidotus variabilis]
MDPFKSHLIALLSIYNSGPLKIETVSQYNGPKDWQTETILRELEGLRKRMWKIQKDSSTNNTDGESSQSEDTKTLDRVLADNTDGTNLDHQSALPTKGVQCPQCGQSVLNPDPLRLENSSMSTSLSSSTHQMASRNENPSISQPESAKPQVLELESSSQAHSPVIPPGPLATAPFENGMSPIEELRLLKAQISDVARVCGAVIRGDLGQRITAPAHDIIMVQMKDLINMMADKLETFAGDVITVTREVGKEGKFGCQIAVKAEGQWAVLAQNVNTMAWNLTQQTRSVSEVCLAVAQGDLSHRLHIDGLGELLELKFNVNTMVHHLKVLVKEVTDLSYEIGTQGTLGSQAFVPDRQGVWKDLVDHANLMAMNHTNVVRAAAQVCKAVIHGDLTNAIAIDLRGEDLEMKMIVNGMTNILSSFARELMGLVTGVDGEGQSCDDARSPDFDGIWKEVIDYVYGLVNNWTLLICTGATVIDAVAKGDLTQRISGVPVSGEMSSLVNTINDMVDQLVIFTTEVKIARDLNYNPEVQGLQGVWQEIIASNLARATASSGSVSDPPACEG